MFVHCVFFVVPNELGITPVGIEVRCYPERISAFTLLGVCMIVPGPPSSGNLNSEKEILSFSRKESCPGLKPSGRYENQTSNRLALSCPLRSLPAEEMKVCEGWRGPLSYTLPLAERSCRTCLTHLGCYVVSLMDVASRGNIELTLNRFKPPWHQLIL